jgi:two-component system sensor kinase
VTLESPTPSSQFRAPRSDALRILIVEDVPRDADLVQRELRRDGVSFTARVVETREEFLRELGSFQPDIILSDYVMPQFSGSEALEIRNERAPGVPFIIVTASINEETAAECIKKGADDYVTKEHLARLAAAVDGALRKKRLEEAERQARQGMERVAAQWRATFDAIHDAIFLMDDQGRIQRCNRALQELAGKPYHEIIGRPCCEVMHGTTVPPADCPLIALMQTHRREKMTLHLNDRWLDVTIDPILDHAGKLIGTVHIVTDVTERKWAEEALRDRESLLSGIVSSLHETMIVVFDRDARHKYVWADPALESRYGFSSAALVGRSPAELLPPQEAQERIAQIQRIFETGEPLHIEFVAHFPTGDFWHDATISPMRDPSGEVMAAVALIHDITDRKRAEARMTEQLDELRRWQKVVLGRESRIQELKREVNDLCRRLGEVSRYQSEDIR